MLEFVDSGLYYVQDENNFINPTESGSSSLDYTKKTFITLDQDHSNGCTRIQICNFLKGQTRVFNTDPDLDLDLDLGSVTLPERRTLRCVWR